MKPLPGLLAEAVLVVAAGAALGWAGNALSPRGLRVDRDYFPRTPVPVRGATGDGAATGSHEAAADPDVAPTDATGGGSSQGTAAEDAAEDAAADAEPAQAEAFERLRARGLVPVAFEEARALYEGPLYAAGAYVFLDARHEEDHALGHIPGARVFDHYHLERYLADVLALAPGTMRMVVYCSGGDCEDSEFAAATLAGMLPDPSILRVYVGGMEEWRARGMPVETGASGSGQIEAGPR
jgi:rhodanese-related sulfurtransferase